jgi:hypothetical protein
MGWIELAQDNVQYLAVSVVAMNLQVATSQSCVLLFTDCWPGTPEPAGQRLQSRPHAFV